MSMFYMGKKQNKAFDSKLTQTCWLPLQMSPFSRGLVSGMPWQITSFTELQQFRKSVIIISNNQYIILQHDISISMDNNTHLKLTITHHMKTYYMMWHMSQWHIVNTNTRNALLWKHYEIVIIVIQRIIELPRLVNHLHCRENCYNSFYGIYETRSNKNLTEFS